MYSNIVEMDTHVGVVLEQLEEDGLLEDTVVVWFSDPRRPAAAPEAAALRFGPARADDRPLSGQGGGRGETDDRLISFVDFAPTLLSQAGIPVPGSMQGRAFRWGVRLAPEPRLRVSPRARPVRRPLRHDPGGPGLPVQVPCATTAPGRGITCPLDYREQMATMQELLRLRDANALNPVQAQWFRTAKPEEELFDTAADPHELDNLRRRPRLAGKKLLELRQACREWMDRTGDLGFVPEAELIERFWPGRERPVTASAGDQAAGRQGGADERDRRRLDRFPALRRAQARGGLADLHRTARSATRGENRGCRASSGLCAQRGPHLYNSLKSSESAQRRLPMNTYAMRTLVASCAYNLPLSH